MMGPTVPPLIGNAGALLPVPNTFTFNTWMQLTKSASPNGIPLCICNRDRTIIIPNHPSVKDNLDVVYEYFNTEVATQRMSGPFSCEDTECILRGLFYASPLIVAIQDQGPLYLPNTGFVGKVIAHRACLLWTASLIRKISQLVLIWHSQWQMQWVPYSIILHYNLCSWFNAYYQFNVWNSMQISYVWDLCHWYSVRLWHRFHVWVPCGKYTRSSRRGSEGLCVHLNLTEWLVWWEILLGQMSRQFSQEDGRQKCGKSLREVRNGWRMVYFGCPFRPSVDLPLYGFCSEQLKSVNENIALVPVICRLNLTWMDLNQLDCKSLWYIALRVFWQLTTSWYLRLLVGWHLVVQWDSAKIPSFLFL